MNSEILLENQYGRLVAQRHTGKYCKYVYETKYTDAMGKSYWAENSAWSAEEKFKAVCSMLDEFVTSIHVTKLEAQAWSDVRDKWANHPSFKEHRNQMTNQGTYGASRVVNSWIAELLERVEE